MLLWVWVLGVAGKHVWSKLRFHSGNALHGGCWNCLALPNACSACCAHAIAGFRGQHVRAWGMPGVMIDTGTTPDTGRLSTGAS